MSKTSEKKIVFLKRFACQNCTKTFSRKTDRDTHNIKCIKTRNYKYDFSQTMQTQRNQYH